jgi:hypothetical protein
MWPMDFRREYYWMYKQPSMYEVGAFFLSHKMVVKRMKNKRRRGR